ncbi:unnamed protein product [Soboliphyme baturini]|uniref:NADH dehydrogenase [ubiquinone] flavoprotein 3, mitochondrial n=1 Tax=Soboliphyme baturini TaxID=241478 RepID=A0A183IQF0_9BILA|nr:unnamed protein product [Soboliphyme baturini]
MALRLFTRTWITISKAFISNSASRGWTSGIEHSDALSKLGKTHKIAASKYKCQEYYNYNEWSFYDLEMDLTKYRLPQPNPKIPDSPRDTSPSPTQSK